MKTAIIGATGYGGIELLRLLMHHPVLKVSSIHSFSQTGEAICAQYPHLQSFMHASLQEINIDAISETSELVFLATPPGVSRELTPQLRRRGLKVVDLSGDFRMKEPEVYEKWYKRPAPAADQLQQAVYGLTEWKREEVGRADLIANPGCYATATLLAAAPLMREGIIDERTLIVDAKSGVSGAGKSPNAMTHFPEIHDNLKIYKVHEHQHVPEIEQMLLEWNTAAKPITFSTHLIPITRGIMVTMYAQAKDEAAARKITELYKQSYDDAAFVRVREGTYPSPKEVCGSNFCDIGAGYDERTGRLTVVSVIDNLMKGAAGQAVQNANVRLGLDEQTGLQFVPLYP
ncbi:N-acetyl-gamma-glutamyl-phosphate reductase [Ectobacillus ponti]|uniref:N-acetyl-gamma-glutamyl-phosphate reductase n=1 Tax=Ectobacillus ponti TaxID=2961894 RepID=A0AA41X5G3_9BACI|nr:N-acetyl-gamma-glutamyl-phosphate reductase [Ectobacillus ponti]MCP8966994.1 N-acetyl-gamma-glutamyl-phosphate reductase [Ectobacillus ponti]